MDYNNLAGEYALHRKIQPEVLKDLLISGKINPTSKVLEIGCGTGNYIIAIQQMTGCECWGIDPSESMLSSAREQSSTVQFSQGAGERLDFSGNSFDLVFSVDVIHHVQDRLQYFREAYRVLTSGGLMCTTTESDWMIRKRQPFAVYFPETVEADLARYPSIAAIHNLMTYVGFSELPGYTAEFSFLTNDIQGFRDKAFSCLHLIPEQAFQLGIERMVKDLQVAPIEWISRYIMVWGKK